MKIYYEWTVKEIRLKSRKKFLYEFKYEALQAIVKEILDGKFIIEIKGKEIK